MPSSARARVIVAAGLVFLIAGCAMRGGESAQTTLAQRVEHATTRADHEALAQQYDAKAEMSRREAAEHRTLLTSYAASTEYRWIDRVGSPGGMRAMPRHCEQLIRNAEDDARVYAEMADTHRALAREAADKHDASGQRN